MTKTTYRLVYYDGKEYEIDADENQVVNLEGGLFYSFYKMVDDRKQAFFQTPVHGVRFIMDLNLGNLNVSETK
jgi:hypothetical protein